MISDLLIWYVGRGYDDTNLRLVRPLISEFVHEIEFTEWTQDPAHKTGFSDCTLYRVETGADEVFSSYHTGNRTGYLSENIVSSSDGPLSSGDGLCDMFCCFEAGVNQWHRDHPETMLHTGR